MQSTNLGKKNREPQPSTDEPAELSAEQIARAIVAIDESMKKLCSSGLNQTGIVALLHDDCNLPKRQIKLVLSALQNLRNRYCS